MTGSLTKLATAIVAIISGIEAHRSATPYTAEAAYGDSNTSSSGYKMTMHKTKQSDRKRSREEYEAMKR